jgi:hypothetical protein
MYDMYHFPIVLHTIHYTLVHTYRLTGGQMNQKTCYIRMYVRMYVAFYIKISTVTTDVGMNQLMSR